MPAKAPILYPNQARLLRELGARVRDARLRRRYTVTQVAERAGVSRPTLNKVEQGDGAVTMGNWLRVLAVLGLEKDLALVAAEDPVGRRLQDARLTVPRRAPKRTTLLRTPPVMWPAEEPGTKAIAAGVDGGAEKASPEAAKGTDCGPEGTP